MTEWETILLLAIHAEQVHCGLPSTEYFAQLDRIAEYCIDHETDWL